MRMGLRRACGFARTADGHTVSCAIMSLSAREPDREGNQMSTFATETQKSTKRGTAFLNDIAGAAATSAGVADLLEDACKDPADWACIFLALSEWDDSNKHVGDAIAAITEAAKDYCAEWIAKCA